MAVKEPVYFISQFMTSATAESVIDFSISTSAENFSHTINCYLQSFEYQIIKMLRTNILSVALLVLLAVGCGAAPCPATNYQGSIYSAQIIAALDGGVIPFNDGLDTQCYNYSLPYSFNTPPDVAVSIHSFEAEASNSWFFFIKPIRSDSLSFLPFVVRTQWPYTQWNQISFTFIAEDRNDIEVGYYQIDSGPLAGCESGKNVDVLLPFRSNFRRGMDVKQSIFLHGFEIATVKSEGNTRSPFEFQIISSSANISGIAVSISVTTSTQVNSLYISYVAFQQSSLAIMGGGYVYDAITDGADSALYYAPETIIPKNFARIYGLTGFLLMFNKNRVNFNTKWDGFAFNFNFGDKSLLKYFSFSFVFFTGSQCQDCVGYQIFDNNACVSVCPLGSALTPENTCINCGTGREWNGTTCITKCTLGQYFNTATGNCECPPTLNWDGSSCIPCLAGKVFMPGSKSCECPKPLVWNGYSCSKIDPCVAGKVWDVYTYSCQCPDTTYWTGDVCKAIPVCPGGQVLDSNYTCGCPTGYVWANSFCIYNPCNGGQTWTGTKCICPIGLNYNGSMCLECINGQKWDTKTSTCVCDSGYRWNGQYCEKSYVCLNGRVWNPTYQQCICPDGSYWSGYSCLPTQKCLGGQYFDSNIQKCACLSGSQWDGKVCITCVNGKTWNVTSLTCTCPPGTIDVPNGCRFQQQCSGGKQWIQNSWTCECPPGAVWNGNFCILNACLPGQTWNDTSKSCQCAAGKVLINSTCLPPQIACTNGRVWNQYIYACSCPPGSFPQPTRCDPIPTCTTGKVYNPLNNQCQCPFGLADLNGICTDPKCPIGQYWNGGACQVINCPPPSYFNKDRCVYGSSQNCGFGYIWNGVQCVYYPSTCPSGTSWSQNTCQNSGSCGNGYYQGSGSSCVAFPQQCPPPTQWDGSKCVAPGNLCPQGTYAQGNKCYPYQACTNGFMWDTVYLRCICPIGTINSGNNCVSCSGNQVWSPSTGCACPDGAFDTGASCEFATQTKCAAIINSKWDGGKCMCLNGFTKVGFQCVCYGTQVGTYCDKCSYKPNSNLNPNTNVCECKNGYTEIAGNCVLSGIQISNQDPNSCAVGTYFEQNHKACLACPEGCLSCQDCYRCKLCRPEFVYDPPTQQCYEICGDGKKFTAECDDGNNIDGDGCSRDCKIEQDYTCTGGCPESKDNCFVFRPSSVKIEQIGQIRRSTSLIINVKLNYMPGSLIQSNDCANKCSQILVGTITGGDKSAVSITAEYLPGTKYIFAVTVEFGRTYMAKFTLNVAVNSAISKYFGGLQVQPLDITVEPSYLMAINNVDKLE